MKSVIIDTISLEIDKEHSFIYLNIIINYKLKFDMILRNSDYNNYLLIDISSPYISNEYDKWIPNIRSPNFLLEHWDNKSIIKWIINNIDYFINLFNNHLLLYNRFKNIK